MTYITNIIKKTEENTNFRTVLFTGDKSQLVVMDIPGGGEIGKEKHAHVEQTIFILSGQAKVTLDGKETEMGVGDVVVVTPGRVHVTKEDADVDAEDEKFGESIG